MNIVLFIPVLLSFLVTLYIMPFWIGKAKQIGLLWHDMNKYKKPMVAGSGGIIAVMAFVLSVLVYIAINTFYFGTTGNVINIFALMTTVLMLAGTGFVDDLLGWQRGGLSVRSRIIMCIFASIPLVVVNAGISEISLPFFGNVSLGLLYPLLLIPLGVTGAATTYNFLAGYNGLEASQGIIILSALALVTWLTGTSWLAMICLLMVFALMGFWLFNKYPAKVFPGNSITYAIGGLIACAAIFGNIEKIAIFFFIPYIIEVILKSRGGLKKQSFGKPNKDDSLEMPYGKIYGVEHWAIAMLKKIKEKVHEKDVVKFINLMQIVIIVLGLVLFSSAIF